MWVIMELIKNNFAGIIQTYNHSTFGIALHINMKQLRAKP